jgi:transposase
LCVEQGYEVLATDPPQEAWRWKTVKRKTDQDDALKLAKLAVLQQINSVYVPAPETRQGAMKKQSRKDLLLQNDAAKAG